MAWHSDGKGTNSAVRWRLARLHHGENACGKSMQKWMLAEDLSARRLVLIDCNKSGHDS